MVIVSGSCGSFSSVTCEDNASSGNTETYTFSSTAGTTYYVYISHYSNTNSTTGTFTISRTCIIPPPNDLCANPTNLPCGTSNLAGYTTSSSNTPHGTGCLLSDYGVWYSFTGDGQITTISSTASGGFDQEMSIAYGACGSLTNLVCEDGSGSNGTESYTFITTLGINFYVYIAGFNVGSTTTGAFTISRTCTATTPAPSNDACLNSTVLTMSTDGSCNSVSSTVYGGTNSLVPACGGTANDFVT